MHAGGWSGGRMHTAAGGSRGSGMQDAASCGFLTVSELPRHPKCMRRQRSSTRRERLLSGQRRPGRQRRARRHHHGHRARGDALVHTRHVTVEEGRGRRGRKDHWRMSATADAMLAPSPSPSPAHAGVAFVVAKFGLLPLSRGRGGGGGISRPHRRRRLVQVKAEHRRLLLPSRAQARVARGAKRTLQALGR